MMPFLLGSFALLVLAADVPASGPAPETLEKVRRAFTASPAVLVRFEQTFAPAGFPAEPAEAGTLWIQPPALLRFDYEGPEGKVFTFDGTTARQYVKADHQLVERRLGAAERSRLPLVFLEAPASTLARFRAEVSAAGPRTTLTLRPVEPGDIDRITLAVKRDGFVEALEVVSEAGDRTTFLFRAPTARAARPLSDFQIAPPPGTRVVTGREPR